MRPRMSDAYGRASFLCAFVPPQSFPCVENDRAIGAATADKALAEARSILAETEIGTRKGDPKTWWGSVAFRYVGSVPYVTERDPAFLALAESLRSWVR